MNNMSIFSGFKTKKFSITLHNLPSQILSLIAQYEISLGYKAYGFKQSKTLSDIERSIGSCLESIPKNGKIEKISVLRKSYSWFSLALSSEPSDDYFLFRSHQGCYLYLIGIDPSFMSHAKRGYVKDSKIYVTLAAFDLSMKSDQVFVLAFFFNGTKHSDECTITKALDNPPTKNSNFKSKSRQKNEQMLTENQKELHNFYPNVPLVYYPINLGEHNFAYEKSPPRWYVQQSLSSSKECWMKRSVLLSHEFGPLEDLSEICRPIAFKNTSPIMAIYPCRFGDLSHLIFSPESYLIRNWLASNPFVFIRLISQLLEMISKLHLQQVDLSPFTLIQGRSFVHTNSLSPNESPHKSKNSSNYLVHTDLKLDNILFQPQLYTTSIQGKDSINFEFKLELTDFDGLANEGQQMQGNTTPGYASPQMEMAYKNKTCYYVSQSDDAFATGEIILRFCQNIFSDEHPVHETLYQNCLKKLIMRLKHPKIIKRDSVVNAHSLLLVYISSLDLYKMNLRTKYLKSENNTNDSKKVWNKQVQYNFESNITDEPYNEHQGKFKDDTYFLNDIAKFPNFINFFSKFSSGINTYADTSLTKNVSLPLLTTI